MILTKYLKTNNMSIYEYTNYLYSKMEYNIFNINNGIPTRFDKSYWIYPEKIVNITDITLYNNSEIGMQWSNDSFILNEDIWIPYIINSTQNFGDEYYKRFYPVLELQLMKSGYRIAYYFDELVRLYYI
jgi:hypothetical protein